MVALAAESRQDLGEFLVGLDLAGDEGTAAPEALGTAFVPAFRECLAVTIHAGEGEAADHIWQAAYHLAITLHIPLQLVAIGFSQFSWWRAL